MTNSTTYKNTKETEAKPGIKVDQCRDNKPEEDKNITYSSSEYEKDRDKNHRHEQVIPKFGDTFQFQLMMEDV